MVRNAHTVDDLVQDFHLLCSLCVHDDEPILETQDLIKHAIFANVAAPAEQQLLPCTRVDNGRIIIWGRTPDKGKPFKQWSGRLASKLASIAARPHGRGTCSWIHLDDYLKSPANVEFYEAVLLL
jgi:hypothetical protein